MIVSRAPLRISFAGGGTDFPDFYLVNRNGGSVVSATIDKYIYVVLNPRFDDKIRVSYTQTEIVDHIDDLQHDIVRECLRFTGVTEGIEVITVADIPSEGSGLGSSSSLTVALLRALAAHCGTEVGPYDLADMACKIEIDVLGNPIGKQDQYAAALGGVNHIQFYNDGTVHGRLIGGLSYSKLTDRLMLFYTGVTRRSADILTEQKANIADRHWLLEGMTAEANLLAEVLPVRQDAVGEALKNGWDRKKQLAKSITNSNLDVLVQRALDAGADGCKIAGAGGGGFLLVYCQPDKRTPIRKALKGFQELHFKLTQAKGAEILVEKC